MTFQLDPFKVFNLSRSADPGEFKSAYRALVKKYHPDVNPHGKERFIEIQEAWTIIQQSIDFDSPKLRKPKPTPSVKKSTRPDVFVIHEFNRELQNRIKFQGGVVLDAWYGDKSSTGNLKFFYVDNILAMGPFYQSSFSYMVVDYHQLTGKFTNIFPYSSFSKMMNGWDYALMKSLTPGKPVCKTSHFLSLLEDVQNLVDVTRVLSIYDKLCPWYKEFTTPKLPLHNWCDSDPCRNKPSCGMRNIMKSRISPSKP